MKKKIKQIIKAMLGIKPNKNDFKYKIGNYELLFPYNHKLVDYQKIYGNYDKKLKNIIECISRHQSIETIIDIGANVGDTAALLRSNSNAEIICIEGDKFYFDYLKKNSKIIPNLTIVNVFVGIRDENIFGEIIRDNGTAKINAIENINKINVEIRTQTLENILLELNIKQKSIHLIKTDTDGFDFKILLANLNLISLVKPNIFFEYDIYFNEDDILNAQKLIDSIAKLGYTFIIYDNFGNLIDLVASDHNSRFEKYNHWLLSSRKNGGGIFYLDIFATVNSDIANNLVLND